ncbi:acetamidase/formamidase family protein [Deinococcus yavapaiensis]|uniref:Acetamidase/formamidase n=1 Tax=Deinococcus yavapaiensis KR-236 TaxID=694435 RepID=A0A318SBL1_9DEIO|nr:acetamidase/formamidase family protein [Deinococcus yavapaiensis]PYE54127.1 acetamidase/formamidase [Deinococcus yavapaiensis KR-236]
MTQPAFHLSREHIHTTWDRSLTPALTIPEGATVVFETLDASYGGVARSVAGNGTPTNDALARLIAEHAYPERSTGPRGHPLTGPVFVEGAKPGDTLVVEILDVKTGAWGWTSCRPNGIGLLDKVLADMGELEAPTSRYWDLREGAHARFSPSIRVPLSPFCGVMGVALAQEGQHPTSPPRHVGGNMDVRQLVKGATLYLPVEVEGALFSVGDVHGAQGDGEVCGTGIETDGLVTLKFGVLRGAGIASPQLGVPAMFDAHLGEKGWFATTGHAPDLMEAARIALLEMLRHLKRVRGLSLVDAYILASACVDLKISQIVDAPNWTVSAFLPLVIFED